MVYDLTAIDTETTDGLSSETEKPRTARLATSMASVNQGRPIGRRSPSSTTMTST